MGHQAKAGANAIGGVAIGSSSVVEGEHGVALGDQAESKNKQTIAVGLKSVSSGEQSISIGHQAKAIGNNSIAEGAGAKDTRKTVWLSAIMRNRERQTIRIPVYRPFRLIMG